MRLLRLEEDGNVCLVDYAEEKNPRYAILSHRWGGKNDEATFQDIVGKTGRSKKGYKKICAFGAQAKGDDCDLFWVDTCCIDKTSSAELSESINSMWRWYRKARVCYAYLDDIPGKANININFTQSVWFTRGWTLQELLAPSQLKLYNDQWKLIGTKVELADRISERTKIRPEYLVDNSLFTRASIAERMSWAFNRKTERYEDTAYCLLGIFDVNMPLLYGEGTKAFQRLQEEILKQSNDQSILAWISSKKIHEGRLFAQSPDDFQACGNIVRSIQGTLRKSYATTNTGLQIELPIVKGDDGEPCGVLNCQYRNDVMSNLALPLQQVDFNHFYQRRSGKLQVILSSDWRRVKTRSMQISMTPHAVGPQAHPKENTSAVRRLPLGFEITQVYPPQSWSFGARSFEGNRHEDPKHKSNRTLVAINSGASRNIFFMTYFHETRVFHDWVWDARLLPVKPGDKDNFEQIYNEWQSKELSDLPRVQNLDDGVVVLRAVPQLIHGVWCTTIDILFLHPRAVTRRSLEAAEHALLFLRSFGHRIPRGLYWCRNLEERLSSPKTLNTISSLVFVSTHLGLWKLDGFIQRHTHEFAFMLVCTAYFSVFHGMYKPREAPQIWIKGRSLSMYEADTWIRFVPLLIAFIVLVLGLVISLCPGSDVETSFLLAFAVLPAILHAAMDWYNMLYH